MSHATCPSCGSRSCRVHSRYRTLQDLPCNGQALRVRVIVRRFLCMATTCRAWIFAECSLRLDFDRRLKLDFDGPRITSDAGLLAYCELDALGLSALVGDVLANARTGRNGRHALVGLLRHSVFGRLAGYENVNDALRCESAL